MNDAEIFYNGNWQSPDKLYQLLCGRDDEIERLRNQLDLAESFIPDHEWKAYKQEATR